nr:MAG TPA: hypothetical protein [Microviridae sp.]
MLLNLNLLDLLNNGPAYWQCAYHRCFWSSWFWF